MQAVPFTGNSLVNVFTPQGAPACVGQDMYQQKETNRLPYSCNTRESLFEIWTQLEMFIHRHKCCFFFPTTDNDIVSEYFVDIHVE